MAFVGIYVAGNVHQTLIYQLVDQLRMDTV